MDSGLCCRCGRDARAQDTFLCSRCLDDPAARQEIRALLETDQPIRGQRVMAVAQFGWAGGWPRIPADPVLERGRRGS